MNNWDEYFNTWNDARLERGEQVNLCLQKARKRVAKNSKNDWAWLKESLSDPECKWIIPETEDLDQLKLSIHCRMLHEFIDNSDIEVRRRIIPMLRLEPESYPVVFRELITLAVKIARTHHDEYIRHRVEIQLGAEGPFMAMPNTE